MIRPVDMASDRSAFPAAGAAKCWHLVSAEGGRELLNKLTAGSVAPGRIGYPVYTFVSIVREERQ
jgi:hypothetical protein